MFVRNALIALITVLSLPLCLLAQRVSTSDSVDLFISRVMQEKKIPALQLVVVRDGKVVKNATYGMANLEHNIKATEKSIFSINSISKAFTGVAIMQLVEAGKLNITDPLSKHLDSLPQAWQQITLQQVLTHTSGLPDMDGSDGMIMGKGDERLAMEEITKRPIDFKPGEKFSYNQTGYVLLGQIITKLSGMHFTKFIESKQFAVADMRLTRFGDSYDVIPNSAGSYTLTKQKGEQFVRNDKPGVAYIQFPEFYRTAAGILSTATDMANWVIALKSGKLLKDKASMETMWTPAVLNNGRIGGFNRLTNGYALGWPTVARAEHPAVAPVGGGRSSVFVYRNDDLSIIVLSNLMGGNPDQFSDEIAGFYIPDMKAENGFGLSPGLKKLNAVLRNTGFEHANSAMANLKKSDPALTLTDQELNGWGYQLVAQKRFKEALSIFKLNASLYPKSANAFDSLGEMYEVLEQPKDALVSYKKSLALDKENKNAAERIKALSKLSN
jgi:CubicO group peptidase (beta-lactamase class C family)